MFNLCVIIVDNIKITIIKYMIEKKHVFLSAEVSVIEEKYVGCE